jgi:hypothetical protein
MEQFEPDAVQSEMLGDEEEVADELLEDDVGEDEDDDEEDMIGE